MKNILEIFEKEGRSLRITSNLVKAIEKYVTGFVNRTDDNLQFLGSPLVGVYPIRFTTPDQNMWWDDILELDDLTIQSMIKEHFDDPSNDLDSGWKVSSNAMNLSLVWLTHKLLRSNLSKRDIERGCIACLNMLQYKFVSSIDAHFFPYPADSEVAKAVYASLNRKYLLKQHGSWMKVIQTKSEELLERDNIHHKALHDMSADDKVIYLINDTQGRHKDIYKRITTLFYEYKDKDTKIQSIAANIELSGEITLRDKQNNFGAFRTSAHEIASNPTSLIRDVAVSTIAGVIHTAPPQHIRSALEWMGSNYGAARVGYIQEFVELVITHACEYIRVEQIPLSDLGTVLVKLRGIHLASRQSDETVLHIRELGEKITKQSVESKNAAVHASVRAAITLYIVLRTLAKDNLSVGSNGSATL